MNMKVRKRAVRGEVAKKKPTCLDIALSLIG